MLSRWWFVHQYMTATFDQFVTNDFGRPEGTAGFKPSVEHFDAMYAFGDRHMVDGRSSVLAVLQGPGDIVQVPPGWPHAVTNLEFCCKLAWDYIDTSNLSTYMVVRRDVACKFFVGENIADDYMAVAPILNAAVVRAVSFNSCTVLLKSNWKYGQICLMLYSAADLKWVT
ncbi:hypothetical protein ABBQ38_006313 [Trebouxia sp. C0009 RCD-2024]